MKNTAAVTRERSEVRDNVSVELGKVGAGAIGITSALFGCWAVVCLAAGMMSSGGPLGLVSNFVAALVG